MRNIYEVISVSNTHNVKKRETAINDTMKQKWGYYSFITFPHNFPACWGICSMMDQFKNLSHRTPSVGCKKSHICIVCLFEFVVCMSQISYHWRTSSWVQSEVPSPDCMVGSKLLNLQFFTNWVRHVQMSVAVQQLNVLISSTAHVRNGLSQFSQYYTVSWRIYSTSMGQELHY